ERLTLLGRRIDALGHEVIRNTRPMEKEVVPAAAYRRDDTAVADLDDLDLADVFRKGHRLRQPNGLGSIVCENGRSSHDPPNVYGNGIYIKPPQRHCNVEIATELIRDRPGAGRGRL